MMVTKEDYRRLEGTHFRQIKDGRVIEHFEVLEWLCQDWVRVRCHVLAGRARPGKRWPMQVRELAGLERY